MPLLAPGVLLAVFGLPWHAGLRLHLLHVAFSLCACVQCPPFKGGPVIPDSRSTLLQSDCILTDYICHNFISELGHILRYLGEDFSTMICRGHSSTHKSQ